MIHLTRTTLRAGLALALGLGLAWTAVAQPGARPGLDTRLDRLGERLSVTDQQAAALDAIAARPSGDPTSSWTAAAAVLGVLTADQVGQLREMRSQRGDRARGRRGATEARNGRGRRGGRAGRGGRTQGRRGDRPQMTDAQREAVRAIRDEARLRRQDLVGQLRDGSISDAAFVEQAQSLRQDSRRRLEAIVPVDAERQARREAARQARDRALGLTDAQREQLQAQRLDRIRQSPAPIDMRPFLDADGRLDRAAYREAQRERRAAARAARRAQGEVLTQQQQDLVMVHRLVSRGGRRGR